MSTADSALQDARRRAMGECPNFRHIGGYQTADGRTTRGDRLFRSGWFSLSRPDELEHFKSLGVQRVFDFRNGPERELQPLELPDAVAATVVPLGIERGSMGPFLEQLMRADPDDSDTKAAVVRMYAEMLDEGRNQFATFLNEAKQADGPIMIMCTLGKDRTGVATALLLAALGVDRATIMNDYLITADAYRGLDEYFSRRMGLAERGLAYDLVRDLFTVHPEYLDAVWRRIDAQFPSQEAFFEGWLSLGEADRAQLRGRFTQ